MPSPGEITGWHAPSGPGVRVDAGVEAGRKVVPFYDSMVAKVMVWGADREQALARARRALDELTVEGIKTTRDLQRSLLDWDEFAEGRATTESLESYLGAARMKFGLTFGLVQVPGMPLTYEQSVADLVSGARDAEELGYDAVHMVEHHFQPDGYNPSPLITLAAAAAVTERVALGTNILLVPLYNPMKLAEDVAVLDNLSHGRLVLGVAPGYVEEEFAGLMVPYEERFKRFEEALDLMQLAWKGEPFSFSGRFFEVPETRLSPAPVQAGGPPLWYGVSGPRLLRRAARRGAALAISPRHTIAEVREHLRQYEEHCDEFGVHPPERPAMREVFVAETREEAERIAAPAVTHLFKELYGKRSAKGERALTSDTGEVVSDHEQVDFANFKQRYIIGTPDDAAEAVAQLRDELGTTELHCWMHMPGIAGEDAMRSARLFAREVIPAFP